jgi:hypothetical protein
MSLTHVKQTDMFFYILIMALLVVSSIGGLVVRKSPYLGAGSV